MTLHLFNPGHDEALAADTPYYTDTKAARLLGDELRELPLAWAAAGDTVEMPRDWEAVDAIEPWGWDAALAHRLRRAGAPGRLLPDDEALRRIRALSSRATAVRLLREVSDFESRLCTTETEVGEALKAWTRAYVKAPWSSSGRGVMRTDGVLTASEQGRIRRWLRTQGAVVVEPAYDKICDFALEYEALADGTLRYAGLSRFTTDAAGQYTGNVVAEEASLREGLPSLDGVAERVAAALAPLLAGGYRGPLGVDMMWLADGRVHPCVEINLRRTMGWAALQLRRYVPPGERRRFTIRPKAPLPPEARLLTPSSSRLEAVLMPFSAGGAE